MVVYITTAKIIFISSIGFLLGVSAAFLFENSPILFFGELALWISFLGMAILMKFVQSKKKQKSINLGKCTIKKCFKNGLLILKVVTAFFIGFYIGTWRGVIALDQSQGWVEGKYKGIGTVVRFSEQKNEYQKVYLQIKGLQYGKNKQPLIKKENIVAFTPLHIKYDYGQEYYLECNLKNPQNKYDKFNYVRFLASKKVYQVCKKPILKKISNKEFSDENFSLKIYFQEWHIKFYRAIREISFLIEEKINKIFPTPESGYLAGLLLGGDSRLPEEVVEYFKRTGTTHVIAVSGSNIAIIASILLWIGIASGLWRKQAFYLVLLGVGIFVIMIGSPSSAVRAGIMGAILLYATQKGRLANSMHILVLTAVVMVWLSPFIIFYDVGFQLSFLATMGIILIYGPLSEMFNVGNDFLSIKSIILVTISAQLGVLGVLIYVFEKFSVISLIANIVIIPLIPLIMLGGVVAISGAFLSISLGNLIALPVEILLHFELKSVEYLSQIPGVVIKFSNFGAGCLFVYYIFFFILVFYIRKWQRKN